MTFRAYADNVVIQILPLETETASGLTIVHSGKKGSRDHRTARVLASGPGHRRVVRGDCGELRSTGPFIPNEVKEGDLVIVDALAGQDYAMDLTCPRHNKPQEFQQMLGDKGEFRVIREGEILAVIDEGSN